MKPTHFTKPSSIVTYGLRALVDLALHERTGPVTVRMIARRQEIPVRSLEQVLNRLKRGGVVQAERGPRGGYRLSKAPSQIPVSRIFQSLTQRQKGNGKGFAAADPAASVWRQMEKAVATTLEATTLETLVTQAREQTPHPITHRFTFHI